MKSGGFRGLVAKVLTGSALTFGGLNAFPETAYSPQVIVIPEPNQEQDITLVTVDVGRDLEYYISNPAEFSKLSAEDKNKLVQETNDPVYKDALFRGVLEYINKRTHSLSEIINTHVEVVSDEYNRRNPEVRMDLNSFKKLLKEMKGIDLDERVKLELIRGFDSSDLKWQKEDIIGNGKVWLDLESVPFGVENLKYSNGKFYLKFKDKGTIVLGEGATNEKGIFSFLKNEKRNVNLRLKEILSLREGEVEITKNGFKINKGKFSVGEYIFSKTEEGDSNIKVFDDRFILNNVEFTKIGYATLESSDKDSIVHIGNMNGLLRQISFNDRETSNKDIGKVWFWFDETGKLTQVAKEKINNGDLVFIREIKGNLKKIYENSGSTVRNIISKVSEGERIDYDYVHDRFYGNKEKGIKGDDTLKSYAGEISNDYYHANFLNINGENIGVGGRGRVEILKNMNSVVGYNSETYKLNFDVVSGDFSFRFDGDKILGGRQSANTMFDLGEISLQKQDESYTNSYKIKKQDDGLYITEDSGTFVAGRETRLLPEIGHQSSIDISIRINSNKLEYLNELGNPNKGWIKDRFIDKMKNTDFESVFEIYLPSLWSSILSPSFLEIITRLQIPVEDKSKILNPYSTRITNNLSKKITSQMPEKLFGYSKISFSIRNNPNKEPTLYVNFPNSESRQIELSDSDASNEVQFLRDINETLLRMPDVSKGKISSYSHSWWTKKQQHYWTGNLLKRLWNNNLGRGFNEWERVTTPGDEEFFKGPGGIIRAYFK